MCQPPTINSNVGFFDGFQGVPILWTYVVVIGFTAVYQLYLFYYRNPKVEAEWERLKQEMEADPDASAKGIRINATTSSGQMNLYRDD